MAALGVQLRRARAAVAPALHAPVDTALDPAINAPFHAPTITSVHTAAALNTPVTVAARGATVPAPIAVATVSASANHRAAVAAAAAYAQPMPPCVRHRVRMVRRAAQPGGGAKRPRLVRRHALRRRLSASGCYSGRQLYESFSLAVARAVARSDLARRRAVLAARSAGAAAVSTLASMAADDAADLLLVGSLVQESATACCLLPAATACGILPAAVAAVATRPAASLHPRVRHRV